MTFDPTRLLFIFSIASIISTCYGWMSCNTVLTKRDRRNFFYVDHRQQLTSIFFSPPSSSLSLSMATTSSDGVDDDDSSTTSQNQPMSLDKLIDMDVVVYSNSDDTTGTKKIGAMQEDGILSPLSTWTTEPAFDTSIEFLVDEEDRFALDELQEKLIVHYLISESELSYGSRQCHRGVGNPHGEESELLYYVDQSVIDKFNIEVTIKPDLEILW